MAVTRKDTAALTGAPAPKVEEPKPPAEQPAEQPAQTPPAEQPAQTPPAEQPAQTPPAEQPAQTPPAADVEESDAEPAGTKPALPFISEGVRQDLEMWGKATDPVTGAELVMDRNTGDITITLRT